MFEVLYQGFDGLDLSFMAQISSGFCEALECAKRKAQETHHSSPLTWNGVRMVVSECGARGGYAFLASTGPFGATWFFKKPNLFDPWGVRVSCSSFILATKGLGGTRAELGRTLELLGVCSVINGVSIGRVDYAIDLLAPGFELDPQRFVMHSNMNRADHIEPVPLSVHGRSGRVSSVTVGKMPGRQVIVYDKRAEVIARRKVGWWAIWNAARANADRPPLNQNDSAESGVWRVELRAGKSHLKDRWGIRTWSELDSRFGDMIAASLDAVRYTRPSGDSNRSRWPDDDLWGAVRRAADADLFEMRMWAAPDLVKRIEREAYDELLARQMTGLLIARGALAEINASELLSFANVVGREMGDAIACAYSRYEQKLAEAMTRFSLGLVDGAVAT